MALLMIVASHRITRKKRLVPAARAVMGKHAVKIWHNYFDVFNENSQAQRLAFFSDRLIKFLWASFRDAYANQIQVYLDRISTSELTRKKKKLFFKDIR